MENVFKALPHVNEIWVTDDGHFHLHPNNGGSLIKIKTEVIEDKTEVIESQKTKPEKAAKPK